MDTPLGDPIREKERLHELAVNADAKILEQMFGGKADDGILLFESFSVAYISDTEKGLNMIKLGTLADYQQLADKLAKKMLSLGNATFTLEFLQCAIRLCGGNLNSDDFQKLSSTCNVMKEERKKEEKAVTKKGKKKSKMLPKAVSADHSWLDDMGDDYGDDDFMWSVGCNKQEKERRTGWRLIAFLVRGFCGCETDLLGIRRSRIKRSIEKLIFNFMNQLMDRDADSANSWKMIKRGKFSEFLHED